LRGGGLGPAGAVGEGTGRRSRLSEGRCESVTRIARSQQLEAGARRGVRGMGRSRCGRAGPVAVEAVDAIQAKERPAATAKKTWREAINPR